MNWDFDNLDLSSFCDHPHGLDIFCKYVSQAANQTPVDALFVEIGSYRGGSALHILNIIRQTDKRRFLITIDPYGAKPFTVGEEIRPDAIYDEKIYRDAMAVLSGYSLHHELNHVHYRMTSDDFMRVWESIDFYFEGKKIEKKYGFVYIDGDHNPLQVNREIEYFVPRLVKGGIIALDDITYVKNDHPLMQEIVAKGRFDNFRVYYEKS